jgi:hypothetical protein
MSLSRVSPGPERAVAMETMTEWYFIQGIHRSGTTILGTWLQETRAFRTLTLGELLEISQDPGSSREFAEALEGGERARHELEKLLGRVTRRFDHVRVDRDMFEEHAHLTMREPPFGWGWGIFRRRRPWTQLHPRNVFRLGPDNFGRFQTLSRILARGDPRPQLFKNPFDVSNPFVYGLPARFIFVFREPVDILVSMIQQVRDNYLRWNPYVGAVSRFYRESFGSRWFRALSLYGSTRLGVRVLARRVVTDLEAQMDLMGRLDPARYVCVDYDYMCRDEARSANGRHHHRDHVLRHILASFGLATEGVRSVHSRAKRRANHMPAAVRALRPRLERRLEGYRRKMVEVRLEFERESRDRAAGEGRREMAAMT